jgi:prepilin-type N-terminal cleavage/methylation domain-containing protein
MKNRKNSIKGFTLIEMIVVIALIGILMGVAFPQTTKFLAAGRDTKRISDVSRVVPGYLELYFNQCGNYPGNYSDCDPVSITWSDLGTQLGAQGANVLGNKGLPVATGSFVYCYEPTSNNFGYVLGVQLEAPNKAMEDSVTDIECEGHDCGTDKFYCVQP